MYEFTFLQNTFQIHSSWKATFIEMSEELELIENMLLPNISIIKPSVEDIFRVFETDLNEINAVIIGQDPYPLDNHATGIAFELNNYNNWLHTTSNTSLRNILKEIYRAVNNQIKDIAAIRKEIQNNEFVIYPPNRIFQEWKNNGVFLLNTSLTCLENQPNSHKLIWSCFTKRIITKISQLEKETNWLLWGEEAQNYQSIIQLSNTNKIKLSVHPSKNSFVGSSSFDDVIEEYCVLSEL